MATVTINVTALNAGAVQNMAQVSAAQGDPNLSNNMAITNTVISGPPYNPLPVLAGISPSFVQAGTGSFTLTISGNQFTSTSQVLWNGSVLPTTYSSATQLTAQVDSSLITAMGWAWISVSNPAPGGGLSASQPITVYSVISLDTNHLVFDPFTRQLYASVPGTAPQLQGNSIVAIDPSTGTLGTPVNIGSEPAKIAESDDGLYIYASLAGAQTLARYNLTTGMADPTTYSLNPPGGAARDLAVLPGSDNTLAIDMGSFTGNGIYDISNGTGKFRSKFTGGYTGSSLAFPDASHLYTKDSDTSGNEFYRWNVTADGLTAIDGSTLNGMSQFRLSNGLVYAAAGGFADPVPTPPKQLAQYQIGQALGGFQQVQGVDVAPDPALDRVFFLGSNFYGGGQPILMSYDQARYELLAYNLFPQNPAGPDLVRWGKDGLAFQEGLGFMQPPGSGRLILLRGAFVLPEWGTVNPTPGLTSVSPSSAQAGGGNFYLTATGSNFVPGAVLLWNGSERTTTYLDAMHLKVAIPAADIAKPGTATLTVVNPGSAPSGGISFPIQ